MKTNKEMAVVDVDETLWSFSSALYDTVTALGMNFPPRNEWSRWNIFWDYATKEEMIPIFEIVHAHQCNFKPYKRAKSFLDYMHENYYVIIASHRNPRLKIELETWLDQNNLPYDKIYAGYDKTLMFHLKNVKVVVDDRDETLDIARKKGKIAAGLKRPWNVDSELNVNDLLFDNLDDIKSHLMSK
jgi:hypothetical protein